VEIASLIELANMPKEAELITVVYSCRFSMGILQIQIANLRDENLTEIANIK
jgi:hypothetical protein